MNVVDQKLAAARRLLNTLEHAFRRQGSVVATWRQAGGRRLGPYYALRYRDGGRQRSFYLGRCAQLAEKVRGLLADVQAPRRKRWQLQRLRRLVEASLRRHRRAWRAEFERFNERHGGLLTRHGYDVRGWGRLTAAIQSRRRRRNERPDDVPYHCPIQPFATSYHDQPRQ